MYKRWLDRVNNLLDVEKDLGLDLISTTFTRRELIELKLMIETLKDLEESGAVK